MKQRFGMVTAFLALSLLLFHFVFHPTYAGEWQPLSAAMERCGAPFCSSHSIHVRRAGRLS